MAITNPNFELQDNGDATANGGAVLHFLNDSGIGAGAVTAAGGAKTLRAQAIALENRLPYVSLVESAGANLLEYRVEGWSAGGRFFANYAKLSAAGIPTVTVLHGSSTAPLLLQDVRVGAARLVERPRTDVAVVDLLDDDTDPDTWEEISRGMADRPLILPITVILPATRR